MEIPIAVIMKEFRSYGKKGKKEDKETTNSFKTYILIHTHKINDTHETV
ncbi:MAG: hypothetical protein WC695_00970 [Candidatus Omnitrophota bacterium]